MAIKRYHDVSVLDAARERIRKALDNTERTYVAFSECWAPSWRRMCKVLLRNDWWCKGLGQTQPKSEAYQKFLEIKRQRETL